MKVSECKDIFALLSEYLDEELPDDVCHSIETHIQDCAPCVKFVESLKKSIQLTRCCKSAEEPRPLPDGARDELMAAYRKMLAAREK
jgi:hypothetical protein